MATELGALDFSNPSYQGIFSRMQQMVDAQATVAPLKQLAEFPPEEQHLISRAAMGRYPELNSGSEAVLRQSLEQCLQTLKINAFKRRLKAVGTDLRTAGTSIDNERLAEYQRLAVEREALKEVRHGAS